MHKVIGPIWKVLIVLTASLTFILVLEGRNIFEQMIVEKKTIAKGSFQGFEIGSTKDAVIQNAKSLKIVAIAAIPYKAFEIKKGNFDSINEIIHSEAIFLTNNNGERIDLQFENGKVKKIDLSVPAKGNNWFNVGQDVHIVVEKIQEILDEHPEFIVMPTVQNQDWIYLNNEPVSGEKLLYTYDAWTFHGPERFSNFNIYFDNGKLKIIKYTRPRIELP